MSRNKFNRRFYKKNYIRTKNKIRQSASEYGGLFDSPHIIDGENQWIDFFFLSKKDRIYYNAEIITAKIAYEDELQGMAFVELNNILGQGWLKRYPLFNERKDPARKCVIWEPTERKPIAELGGMTWIDWLDKKKNELADSGQVYICESVSIDYSYNYGRGLQIIKNVDNITVETISNFINEFISTGEQAYQSDRKLTFTSKSIIRKLERSNAIKNR